MKIYLIFVLACFFLFLSSFAETPDSEPLKMKGFSLGMDKAAVKKIYQQMEKEKVATYISIEREEYRDLIKLDNEFSSMGNKIEIEYDDKMKAKNITFQYTTVDILFEAIDMEAEVLVKLIEKKYNLPEMVFEDQGFVKIWKYINEKLKYKISVDDYKNLRLQRIEGGN